MLKPTLSFSTVILETKEKVLQIKHTSCYLDFVLMFWEYFFLSLAQSQLELQRLLHHVISVPVIQGMD